MNKIIVILLCLLAINSHAQEKGFVIRGHVPGMPDSLNVALLTSEDSIKMIAETFAKDGYFELKGAVEHPMMCSLVTNNQLLLLEGNVLQGKVRWTYTPVFVDNVEMEMETLHYDSIPSSCAINACFKIVGGKVQEDFNEFNLLTQEKGDKKEVWWEFIESHPNSVVSVYLGNKMMKGSAYEMSYDEVERLERAIEVVPADTLRFAQFKQNCAYAKLTAKGSPLVDLELRDLDGNPCNLVDIIPKGKYVLVDFWATWCGPCMAAIPRIKELAKRYPDTFAVVGVSCDSKIDVWKTAVEKEQAPWNQYILTKQGYKDFLAKYQTNGVPYFLILDKEGRVLSNPGYVETIEEEVERLCK